MMHESVTSEYAVAKGVISAELRVIAIKGPKRLNCDVSESLKLIREVMADTVMHALINCFADGSFARR